MAITWDVKITVMDVTRKEVSVTATRTDSADPTNPRTYNIISALIATAAQKTGVLNGIWAMHQTSLARDAAIAAFVGTLEAEAKTNLEARER